MIIQINITQPSFFIYDYETFGINPALDRPAQFAGIRTNSTLQPIEKEKVFFCRLSNDYLPNPQSVLITGITPQDTSYHGLIESEFASRIHQLFCIPNTCILGYNNIHFDDEFSRNIFYRNFYDPYSWAYQRGNSRWDLLHILRACYSLCPNGITWPLNTQNKPSFRLKDLTQANSIKHINAHNAMSDVYATLELAKLIKEAQPQLFQFLFNHRTKYQLKKIIDLNSMNPLIFITNKMNNKYKNFITYVAPIAQHPTNPNILIACDLNGNIDALMNFNVNTIHQKLYSDHITIHDIFKKIPLRLIRLNACPILIPIKFVENNKIQSNYIMQFSENYRHCFKHLNFLRMNENGVHLRNKINTLYTMIDSYVNQQNLYNNLHVDSQLYHKFFSNSDRKIIENIRKTHSKDLKNLCTNHVDTRLKPLLFYYRARNFPNTLNYQEQQKWLNYKKNKLFNKDQSPSYNDQLNTLLSIYKYNEQNITLIRLLQKYYQHLYKTCFHFY
ncbi:exodeoxyribonuclease I [Blochmannia endosymbiont of Camponotus sp. C-003]|uniref:exodeoxyribonuclease I n=1 Tax=unclassified Candidatus Blochmanniella TaxID=711328 RepID=UPI00202491E1|nr:MULTISPECIES: exodeoxyribonuclease I [unclassified Candidatus Blochmannia]URJ23368.1 exodeoxyribonuclease I [Blochmannia endosymbiont of Camponotus sp. C-003]URJ28841.1 exodeoxyribonuclease I [Blochmannia endosymbiont of Camponotus sp. C-046]